ncbi:MAG: hypothetical protein ACREKM_09050 [Longimicrobiales bacterium]
MGAQLAVPARRSRTAAIDTSAAPTRAAGPFTGLRSRSGQSALLVLLGFGMFAGCSNKQRLGQYDFRNRTLAVATVAPPHADVFSGLYLDVDRSRPIESILRVGSGVARQVAVEGARARVDSAAAEVDVGERMGARVLAGASRHLRTDPVEDGRLADYELEIRVERYGIVASSWSSQAYFQIDADLWLLDGATGRRIWKTDVHATDRVSPSIVGPDARAVSGVVTAWAIANMSAAEIQVVLEGLSDFAADFLVDELAHSLDDARG